ncbi:MAG: hypothetical protein BGO36_00175 [Burkholderiales bacterium 68-10]|nr:MAG: hypothetical protein BGO36_00175 [Burkholderiales bacterium 68-10]
MKGTGGRWADSGDGGLAASHRGRWASAPAGRRAWAWAPHSRKASGRGPATRRSKICEVRACQPMRAWLPACPASTVRLVLSSSTPWRAQCASGWSVPGG